ncbi:MAG: glycerophosphoryl diester phosphodiesterase membrane domain-containing protein [Gemmatimonadales bacterium]
MTPPALRPLSVGEILDVSFTLYRRHFASLAVVALVCSGIPVLLNMYIAASGGMLQNLSLLPVYYVVLVALNSIATAATVFIVSDSYLGRPINAGTALRRAAPLIVRILICSMLTALVVGVGFVLLVIPGIILIAGLILSIPALVIEGKSASAALSRSWELSRGSRWRILGLLLVLVVLLYVPVAAIGAIAAIFLPGASTMILTTGDTTATVIAVAIGGLIQIFVYPLFYCVLTVAYYDLRVRKEGFDLEVLAATLQVA